MLHNLLRSTAVLSVILASNAIGIGPANQTRADEPRRLFARRAARSFLRCARFFSSAARCAARFASRARVSRALSRSWSRSKGSRMHDSSKKDRK